MVTIIEPKEKPVTKGEGGVLRVGNTRVSLDSLVYAFNEGAAAEEIVYRYPSINLMQAYAAITYYLQNKPQIDAYIKEREKEREVIKAEIETQFPTASIRERLLSRIGKEQKDW